MQIDRLEDDVVTEGSWLDVRSTQLPHRAITPRETVGVEMEVSEWHAARIAAGIPEWGADYRDNEVFPTDINMDVLGGVDYKKGCFVGQEVASRMKRKGGIRKRTVKVACTALSTGGEIFAGNPVGTVTSCEGEAGLALVRMDRVAKALQQGTPFSCNDTALTFDFTDWQATEIDMHQQPATPE